MDTLEDVVVALNESLDADQFDSELFGNLITTLNELCNSSTMLNYELPESLNRSFHSRILFFDFEFYNEERLIRAQFNKGEAIKSANFELAANMRKLEKDCLKYIEFKKQCSFEKSIFVVLQGFLIYAYFGTAKNDRVIKEYLNLKKGFGNLKIDYLLKCLKNDG